MQVVKHHTPAKNAARGFTLLEVLIVIAILGIIAIGVVLASQRMTASAATSAAKSERQMLQKAVDAMMADARLSNFVGADVHAELWRGEIEKVWVVVSATKYDAGQYVSKAPGKGTYEVDVNDDDGDGDDSEVLCISYHGADLTKVNP